VIVDAAAQLPPKSNLRRFIEIGADLVAFSGGKAIGGPQASGILAGRRDLIGPALVQQLDMDVAPETWSPPALIDRTKLTGIPHHGIGRGFKAGKEEIVGLVTALERFVNADDQAANAALEARLRAIDTRIGSIAGVTTRIVAAKVTGRVPVLELALSRHDASAVSRALQGGDPPVHLSERHAARGILTVDPHVLQPEDDAILAAAVARVLA
jgi:L-seryl-tRNA(Ser) seleniumtransferase